MRESPETMSNKEIVCNDMSSYYIHAVGKELTMIDKTVFVFEILDNIFHLAL